MSVSVGPPVTAESVWFLDPRLWWIWRDGDVEARRLVMHDQSTHYICREDGWERELYEGPSWCVDRDGFLTHFDNEADAVRSALNREGVVRAYTAHLEPRRPWGAPKAPAGQEWPPQPPARPSRGRLRRAAAGQGGV